MTLSTRQVEVFELLQIGLRDKEVADRLSLSQVTVRMHINEAMKKLEAKTRFEAATKYVLLRVGVL